MINMWLIWKSQFLLVLQRLSTDYTLPENGKCYPGLPFPLIVFQNDQQVHENLAKLLSPIFVANAKLLTL